MLTIKPILSEKRDGPEGRHHTIPYHIVSYQRYSNGMEGLRGDRHYLQSVAVVEGISRYRHQGGGQEHADQVRVT